MGLRREQLSKDDWCQHVKTNICFFSCSFSQHHLAESTREGHIGFSRVFIVQLIFNWKLLQRNLDSQGERERREAEIAERLITVCSDSKPT